MDYDFVIKKGVLIKYRGIIEDVIIPKGVTSIGDSAFKDCSKLTSITIPEGVTSIGKSVFWGCRNLTRITIPDSVTSIGDYAFAGCSNLTNIKIPETVTSIGDSAFIECSKLTSITIPEGVTSIGKSVFWGCRNLTRITIPDSVTTIGNRAFIYCSKLTSITIPEGVTSIGDSAFEDCSKLTGITIPESVTSIGNSAFAGCNQLDSFIIQGKKLTFRKDIFGDSLPVGVLDYLISFHQCLSDKALLFYMSKMKWDSFDENKLGELFLRRHGKALLPKYKNIIRTSEKANKVGYGIVNKLKKDPSVEEYNGTATFLLIFNPLMSDTLLQELYSLMLSDRKKAEKAVNTIESDPQLADRLSCSEKKEDNEEMIVLDQLRADKKSINDLENEWENRYHRTFKDIPSVQNKDGNEVKPFVLVWLLTCHEEILDNDLYGKSGLPEIREAARKVIDLLDEDSFQRALFALGRYNPSYSICRYSNETTMKSLIETSCHSRRIPYFIKYSDTASAAELYASHNRVREYAELRNMTELDYRDAFLVSDFGFDESGVKRFQCENLNLSVTVKPDLTLAIYDYIAKKELRSFPSVRKGVDKEQLEKLKEEYKSFRNEIKNYVKERVLLLKKMHINGTAVKKEIWMKVYVGHPVVRQLSRGLVWSDGVNSFIPTEKGITDVRGNIYDPKDNIAIVSVLGMAPNDITEWQNYLFTHDIKQPFEQMWEPVIDLASEHELSELTGLTITSSERYAIKKSLKEKGIDVYSDALERHFDRRRIYFDNYNTMHFGESVKAEYDINEDKSITFTSFCVENEENYNTVNAILLVLFKALVESIIKSDRGDKLSKDILSQFTLAQIIFFISMAQDHNSTQCKAVLMDYKNETYPEYDVLEDLILDL